MDSIGVFAIFDFVVSHSWGGKVLKSALIDVLGEKHIDILYPLNSEFMKNEFTILKKSDFYNLQKKFQINTKIEEN